MKMDIPWIMLRDFNCVRFGHEKISGILLVFEAMKEFNQCIQEADLKDLK